VLLQQHEKIRPRAKKALIIDIDLHYGDGTVSIFRGDSDLKIVNPWSVDENFEYLNMDESRYLSQVEGAFQGFDYDIVGVSAGFDTYLEDWGKLLKMEDYRKIGKAIREGAERCGGRRFAVLQGGYHSDLRYCIKSFVKVFEWVADDRTRFGIKLARSRKPFMASINTNKSFHVEMHHE
jgi:acetoin utilization deacetylase AcuC-like enzyme